MQKMIKKIKKVIIENYNSHACGFTEMRSEGNCTDVFYDGVQHGESMIAYEIGTILGMDLEEPEEPSYDEY